MGKRAAGPQGPHPAQPRSPAPELQFSLRAPNLARLEQLVFTARASAFPIRPGPDFPAHIEDCWPAPDSGMPPLHARAALQD